VSAAHCRPAGGTGRRLTGFAGPAAADEADLETAEATSAARTANATSPDPGFATKSIRFDGATGSASSAPRIRRLTRLRTTAPPTAFEVTIPMRTAPSEEGAATKAEIVAKCIGRPLRRRKAISPARRRRSKRRKAGLDRQAVTALFAASGEDLTAVLRAHPFHEAMDALTATVVGLKSTFHEARNSERSGPISRDPAVSE
jgi:hypothetical protein